LPAEPGPDAQPERRRTRRIVLIGASLALCALMATSVAGYVFVRHLEGTVQENVRSAGDPFRALDPATRPAKVNGEAVDVLVLAADVPLALREQADWRRDADGLDAVMLVHLPADRSRVRVVTLPRLTRASVPGRGTGTLAQAMSWGGPPLLIETVERLTDIRIDHLAAIDFAGFTSLTDSLGGVTVTVPAGRPVEGTRFPAGTYRMDGATALAYVREGDGRAVEAAMRSGRQQSWLRAIGASALSRDLITHPTRLNGILTAASRSLAVDDTLGPGRMRDLALSLRELRAQDIDYRTAPGAPGGPGRAQYVLGPEATTLWRDLRTDAVS
jgi:LCP family protein required for cell wall assembly